MELVLLEDFPHWAYNIFARTDDTVWDFSFLFIFCMIGTHMLAYCFSDLCDAMNVHVCNKGWVFRLTH